MSVTSIRNTRGPEPSIVAVPKIVALLRSLEQVVAASSSEWTLSSCAGP
jgi:hypothetical protein